MIKCFSSVLTSLVVFSLISCGPKIADKVYFNATIWTADSSNIHATVLAIKDNKIIYVGNDMQEGKEKIARFGRSC